VDGIAPAMVEPVRGFYRRRVERYTHEIEQRATGKPVTPPQVSVTSIELEALDAEHQLLIKLRDDGLISDDVLRELQRDIDLATIRLLGKST